MISYFIQLLHLTMRFVVYRETVAWFGNAWTLESSYSYSENIGLYQCCFMWIPMCANFINWCRTSGLYVDKLRQLCKREILNVRGTGW